jgi:DNA-binding transcriptional LysR family regulator
MDRFQAMEVFVKVVECGSFARAAERLGVSTSVASRHVSELEAHLQTRLLHRSTRRLSLTESGREFHERATHLLRDLAEAEGAAAQDVAEPRGTLRLTAAPAFGVVHLAPILDEFLAQHPEVRIEATLSDRVVDLAEEGYDLALRVGAVRDGNVIARRIGATHMVACAAPGYLERRGNPDEVSRLAQHNCLVFGYSSRVVEWKFQTPAGKWRVARVSGTLQSNNANLLREAALRGMGIACLPLFLVGDDLRAGRLVRVLAGHQANEVPIHAVYASRKHLSAKVRVFIAFLADHFARASGPALKPARGRARGIARSAGP